MLDPIANIVKSENIDPKGLDLRDNNFVSVANTINYIETATSHNTRKAYRNDLRHFYAWGGLLPTTGPFSEQLNK